MSPKTVSKLHEGVPEFKELLAFLTSELAKCDTLEGLGELDFKERAYEITVRLRVKERLAAMLAPLLGVPETLARPNPEEYVA